MTTNDRFRIPHKVFSSARSKFPGSRTRAKKRGIDWTGYLYFVPSVVIVLAVTVYPLLSSIWIMMHKYNLTQPWSSPFVGFYQFSKLFSDPIFWVALKNTFIYSLVTIFVSVILGFTIALLVQGIKHGKLFFHTLFITPLLLAPIVVGAIWRLLYNPELGILNYFIRLAGASPVDWLGDPKHALMSVITVDIWQWTPYAFMVILAGLESLDPTPYESAKIDGANGSQIFLYLTLPLLKPLFWVIIMFRFVWSFRTFDTIYALTQGGPGISTQTLSIYIFQKGFTGLDMGYASALSFVMLAITLVIAGATMRRFIKGLRN